MSFERALETSLAAALGDDHALLAELRGAFQASAERHLAALREAASEDDWQDAALRLKGLAASFGATDLLAAAGRAANSRRGDLAAIASIETGIAALAD